MVPSKISTDAYNKQTTRQPNGVWQNFKLAVIVTIVFVIGLFGWIKISDWLKEKEEKDRANRLNEVLLECTDRENSDRCKSLQKKYNITFKYCKSIFDSVKDQYEIVYLPDGSSTIEYHPIWHAVVWEGSSSTPPDNSSVLFNSSTYKDCTDHQK